MEQSGGGVLLSLVVPCFNEEAAIPLFYEKAAAALAEIEDGAAIEFLFINDGSRDGTQTVLRELREKDRRVQYLSFSRNFGKEAAMFAGLEAARGAYIVILDADGQDPPALIPRMLELLREGNAECVGTRRVTRKGEPPVRSFFARRFYALMAKMTDIEVVDGARDFRLMSAKYRDAVLALPERNRFSKGIFPWVGFKTVWLEYENIQRHAGETKWSFWKLFLYSLDGIIAFSTKPLAIASLFGILFFLAAIGFILFVIIRRLIWGDPVEGWASTICVILLCAGVQLFTTGILGQYLAKAYTEVKRRPHYIIQEKSCAA